MRAIIITPEIAVLVSDPVFENGATYQLAPFILPDGSMAFPSGIMDMPVYSRYFSILEKCEIIEVTDEN